MVSILSHRALSRRTFLRGLGASLPLPWLDAMLPALRRSPPAASRFLFVFAPNGKKVDEWRPKRTGTDFELPYLLEPLGPVRSKLTVLGNLALDGARAHGDGPGDHARAAGAFLTGTHPRKQDAIRCGVSVDQVLARASAAAAPFASLELGMEGGKAGGVCDSGYACAYSNHVSWRTPTTPVSKETDPAAVFARLFGDRTSDPIDAARAERRRRSILDATLEDAQRLAGELGAADRGKLSEYLDAVRDLERRIDILRERGRDVAEPQGLRGAKSYAERLDLMYELVALAFHTDTTRSATLMLGNAGSNLSYPFLDVAEGHHTLSHHGGKAESLAKIRKINRFHVERFASLLQRLDAARDGDQSLLDAAAVVYGSGIADGDRHDHADLPVLLAGRLGGRLRGGQHLRQPRETPLANLYLTLLRAAGIECPSFGDSTGELAGL